MVVMMMVVVMVVAAAARISMRMLMRRLVQLVCASLRVGAHLLGPSKLVDDINIVQHRRSADAC